MNLFSRSSLALLLWLAAFSRPAWAVDVGAFYFASCQRHLGVILSVNSDSVTLATTKGDVLQLPRYQIIYWATYPVEDFNIPLTDQLRQVPRTRISTVQNYRRVTLVEGWPLDFTEDKVSFLTPSGGRQVIERNAIWEIEKSVGSFASTPQKNNVSVWQFSHPPSFRDCPSEELGTKKVAYPQQILSDPVAIKRELDRLQQGHEGMERYEEHQRFYAVPQLYRNRSFLGLWHMLGSRHGTSAHRSNNFTPVLMDQTSKGPFGFQQTITTGAAPILPSVHEETQTHFYYRFKADYFHASVMLDPAIAFLGSNYNWSANDLGTLDDKIVEKFFAELGFDFGHFALLFFPAGAVEAAFRVPGRFEQIGFNLPRFGLLYQDTRLKADLQVGHGKRYSQQFRFWRANVAYEINSNLDIGLSFISRRLTYDNTVGNFLQYDGNSTTIANYLNYYFAKKYYVGSLVSRESVSRNFKNATNAFANRDSYLKAGLNFSIGF